MLGTYFYKKYPNLMLIGSLIRIFVYIVRTKYYLLLFAVVNIEKYNRWNSCFWG